MERIAAEITDRAESFPLVGGHNALCRVFDDFQPVFAGDLHDRIHLTGDACIVDGHDSLGLVCDGVLYLSFIDIHCVGTDVDEYRCCARQYDGCGGARKGKTRKDHLVALFQAAQQCCHFQSGGAAGGQKSADRAEAVFNPCVAFLCKLAVPADLVRVDGFLYILKFCADERRNIKGNFCHKS